MCATLHGNTLAPVPPSDTLMSTPVWRFAFALALVLAIGLPASAHDSSLTLVANGYWDGFVQHWQGVFRKQNGIVIFILCVGVLCLFIITRSKAKKS